MTRQTDTQKTSHDEAARPATSSRFGWLRTTLLTTSVAALLVGGAAPAMATVPDAERAASSSSMNEAAHPEGCGIRDRIRIWKNAPEELKTDVREVRAMERGDERRAAAIAIRDRALAGDYGTRVQERAQWVKDNRPFRAAWTSPEFRADAREVRAADPVDRPEFARQMTEKALDGGYGPVVQEAAERAVARCSADTPS